MKNIGVFQSQNLEKRRKCDDLIDSGWDCEKLEDGFNMLVQNNINNVQQGFLETNHLSKNSLFNDKKTNKLSHKIESKISEAKLCNKYKKTLQDIGRFRNSAEKKKRDIIQNSVSKCKVSCNPLNYLEAAQKNFKIELKPKEHKKNNSRSEENLFVSIFKQTSPRNDDNKFYKNFNSINVNQNTIRNFKEGSYRSNDSNFVIKNTGLEKGQNFDKVILQSLTKPVFIDEKINPMRKNTTIKEQKGLRTLNNMSKGELHILENSAKTERIKKMPLYLSNEHKKKFTNSNYNFAEMLKIIKTNELEESDINKDMFFKNKIVTSKRLSIEPINSNEKNLEIKANLKCLDHRQYDYAKMASTNPKYYETKLGYHKNQKSMHSTLDNRVQPDNQISQFKNSILKTENSNKLKYSPSENLGKTIYANLKSEGSSITSTIKYSKDQMLNNQKNSKIIKELDQQLPSKKKESLKPIYKIVPCKMRKTLGKN